MEGNKDEAERCIELAQQSFNTGDREKAERLLKKAERLFPTQKAKGTLHLWFSRLTIEIVLSRPPATFKQDT